MNRRTAICSLAGSSLLLPGIVSELLAADAKRGTSASTAPADPLAPKQPHFAPKAKRVIFLFMAGAPSHLELFDNKPALTKYDAPSVSGTFKSRPRSVADPL